VELTGETLTYTSCKAIKSQILADFVAERTDTQLPLLLIQAECWTLYFDGSVMKTGVSMGQLFVSPSENTYGTWYAYISMRQTI
jgi:hypothetical protein